jgi:hypothetical protein
MSYVDLNTVHNPATGTVAPAAWGDQIRDDLEFLIDPPACNVFHNTTTLVVNGGAGTILAANSELFDNDAMHSTVTNNSRITIMTAGRYLFTASAEYDNAGVGIRQLQFFRNGVAVVSSVSRVPPISGYATYVKTYVTLVCAAADYVEVNAFQDRGASINCQLHEFTALYLTR